MNAEAAQRFQPHRARLVALAYRMLGTRGVADEIVQEAYMRFARALAGGRVTDEAAFLRTVVTRLALDELRAARARRETYPGIWLPEPVVDEMLSPETTTELADDVSVALLLALERLSPLERAAFVLHDVFGVPLREIGEVLEREEAAVRKLAERARTHVRESRPRHPVDATEAQRLAGAFARAAADGDLAGLFTVLARDVVLRSDTGGKVPAAANVVHGVDHVTRMLLGLAEQRRDTLATVPATVNGAPGFVLRTPDGDVDSTIALTFDNGFISALDIVRDPDKLTHVQPVAPAPPGAG